MSALITVRDRAGSDRRPSEVTWAEGPLSLALTPTDTVGLHVGARLVCVLEGALFDCRGHAGAIPADPEGAAAWLADAYARAGRGVFGSLRGEYWALLWDRERRDGVAVTDQLGTHGPYFTHQDGAVHLASELRDLLEALPRTPAPDRLALAHWMMRTVPPDGRTLYDGVRRLPAAHLLGVGAGRPLPRRYWEPEYRPPRRPPAEVVTAEVGSALHTAVARRLTGRPAVLLSGGLDSSAVAALAARADPSIATYSAAFPSHPEADESSLIDTTVASLDIANTRLMVDGGSVLAGAAQFIATWHAPPSTPNLFFWIPLLRRAATDGVTAMLDGEGGDEVFGFSPFLLADHLRHGRVGDTLRLARQWPGAQSPPSRPVMLARLRRAAVRSALPAGAHQLMRAVRPLDTYAPPWLPRDLARAWLDTEPSPFAYKRAGLPRWWSYLVDAITRGHGTSIVFEQARRRAAMTGLQARHPLVDVDLIELVLGYDPELAFDARFGRALLRDAMAGLLDDRVRLRRGKSFFDSVFLDAVAGSERPRIRDLLRPGEAQLGAFVDMSALDAELFGQSPDRHSEGLSGWAITAWRAVTAEMWLRMGVGDRPFAVSDEPAPRFTIRTVGS